MCDIYSAACFLCSNTIPFHLGDFITWRGEVRVICAEHTFQELMPYLNDSTLWFINIYPSEWHWEEGTDDGGTRWREAKDDADRLGGKCVLVHPLTETARNCSKHNHPNLSLMMIPVEGSYFTTKDDKEEEQ